MKTIKFYHGNELEPFTKVQVSDEYYEIFEDMIGKLCKYASFHKCDIQFEVDREK